MSPLEQCVIEDALKNVIAPQFHPLVNDLSDCSGTAAMVAEDRVLRIAGVLLAQYGLGDLFETVFAAVLQGAQPGDGRRFLQAQFRCGGEGGARWPR